jgi:hypothetical protein
MIDWTKPFKGRDGTAARVERILPNGDAILSWEGVNGTQAGVYPPDHPCLSSVLRNPREWWALVDGSILLVGHPSRYDALAEQTENTRIVHVREVLEDK